MKTESTHKIKFEVNITLEEEEARALHDLTAYGFKAFIQVFREKLGQSYIDKHVNGLERLFDHVYCEFPKHFYKFDSARKALKE